jgi:hypothetical protein
MQVRKDMPYIIQAYTTYKTKLGKKLTCPMGLHRSFYFMIKTSHVIHHINPECKFNVSEPFSVFVISE